MREIGQRMLRRQVRKVKGRNTFTRKCLHDEHATVALVVLAFRFVVGVGSVAVESVRG